MYASMVIQCWQVLKRNISCQRPCLEYLDSRHLPTLTYSFFCSSSNNIHTTRHAQPLTYVPCLCPIHPLTTDVRGMELYITGFHLYIYTRVQFCIYTRRGYKINGMGVLLMHIPIFKPVHTLMLFPVIQLTCKVGLE